LAPSVPKVFSALANSLVSRHNSMSCHVINFRALYGANLVTLEILRQRKHRTPPCGRAHSQRRGEMARQQTRCPAPRTFSLVPYRIRHLNKLAFVLPRPSEERTTSKRCEAKSLVSRHNSMSCPRFYGSGFGGHTVAYDPFIKSQLASRN